MTKLLLSSVFKPFAVDDAYGVKENVCELLHNQVTRLQGAFSPRINHRSFGLAMIAHNLQAPTTVLDFPTEEDFVRELSKGYTHVGITFIVPNVDKARRMCQLVRQHAPSTRIIIGGHGTRLPGVREYLGCDEVCIGDGIRFLRHLFGEDLAAPIAHPIMPINHQRRILGMRIPDRKGVLIPGVGCTGRCFFCCTTHFFDGYVPFFRSADELYATMCRIADGLSTRELFIMDEAFLANESWIRRLVQLMEQDDRRFQLDIFTTLADIARLEPTTLVKLGVRFAWIGIESRRELFPKVAGLDAKKILTTLRDHGIAVLASTILFLEHHDHHSLWEDVDYTIGLEPDFIQFMQLSPQPGTPLYDNLEARGLITDLPHRYWHGQDKIWFKHPHFSAQESRLVLDAAFRREYHQLGPGLMRTAETLIRGIATGATWTDPFLVARRRDLIMSAHEMYALLPVFRAQAVTSGVRDRAQRTMDMYKQWLGPMSLIERVAAAALALSARLEDRRVRDHANVYQPPTFVERFRQ